MTDQMARVTTLLENSQHSIDLSSETTLIRKIFGAKLPQNFAEYQCTTPEHALAAIAQAPNTAIGFRIAAVFIRNSIDLDRINTFLRRIPATTINNNPIMLEFYVQRLIATNKIYKAINILAGTCYHLPLETTVDNTITRITHSMLQKLVAEHMFISADTFEALQCIAAKMGRTIHGLNSKKLVLQACINTCQQEPDKINNIMLAAINFANDYKLLAEFAKYINQLPLNSKIAADIKLTFIKILCDTKYKAAIDSPDEHSKNFYRTHAKMTAGSFLHRLDAISRSRTTTSFACAPYQQECRRILKETTAPNIPAKAPKSITRFPTIAPQSKQMLQQLLSARRLDDPCSAPCALLAAPLKPTVKAITAADSSPIVMQSLESVEHDLQIQAAREDAQQSLASVAQRLPEEDRGTAAEWDEIFQLIDDFTTTVHQPTPY